MHLSSAHFDGETYEPAHDQERLGRQLDHVLTFMCDGRWRTLAEIARAVNASEASVSARLRDLRKERFGARQVDRRRRGESQRGLFEYRLVVPFRAMRQQDWCHE